MQYEVAIVGAGPIGIELAVALKQAGISALQLEAGSLASTIAWYAPGTRFFSSAERLQIAGVPLQTIDQGKPTREEYLQYLRTVCELFELEIQLNSWVSKISTEGDGFGLSCQQCRAGFGSPLWRCPSEEVEKHYHAKRVVLAIGDMHRPNLLQIPGEGLAHVSHYLDEVHRYFGKDVVIVGGKNSAVEAAIRLYRIGARVTLVIRGSELDQSRIKYWLYPEILMLIREKRIQFVPNATVQEITTEAVSLLSSETDLRLPADEVLLLTGYRQDKSLFQQLGLKLDGAGEKPKLNEATMESSVPGVYVAGTAVAGTQLGGVREFIETSHIHVDRIVSHLTGNPSPRAVFREEGERES